MNIDEAIKINESLLDGTYGHRDEDMEAALKLGIEALKLVANLCFDGSPYHPKLLLGETE